MKITEISISTGRFNWADESEKSTSICIRFEGLDEIKEGYVTFSLKEEDYSYFQQILSSYFEEELIGGLIELVNITKNLYWTTDKSKRIFEAIVESAKDEEILSWCKELCAKRRTSRLINIKEKLNQLQKEMESILNQELI